ncbi:MAG: branched-chain amino acid aminotransferase [Eubacteriales bacterium]
MSKVNIKVMHTTNPKTKPDESNLGFGTYFTDHMFIMDYHEDKGWYDSRIVPYGPLQMEPSSMVFHYSQETFEGLKAYKTENGDLQLFRVRDNIKRLNTSNARVCIPQLDEEEVLTAITELVTLDSEWIPEAPDTSLYIRPFVIATDPFLGVRPSKTYKFMIILSPVGAYYKEGLNPTKIYVEDKYVRAVPGGTGYAKTGGNYAASLIAQVEAKQKGYSQVLWLDGIHRKYVEEVGTSNAFFKIQDKVYTAPLEGSILSGITRDSAMKIMKHMQIEIVETPFTIDEVFQWHAKGLLKEAFATGTAAVISPIGQLGWKGKDIVINDNKIGELSQKLYDMISNIQRGIKEDIFGWITKIE